ncbi:hypothetical protein pipiens_005144 [Culex pipiens pipiens]|uniref:Uncharacterized protein n=1 Tax=Culex pipiens pipiens TaxID=38569 RepID=A0ABD1CB37_CULPP
MSRRKGRKAAEEATTAGQLATPEIRVDETDVDRVAGGGRVDGGIDLAGGASEPDPPVSETKFIDSCFGHSIEPADPGPEAPVIAGEMGAKMSRRKGRKAAEEATTAGQLATPEIRVDETDVDRVAGGGRVDGGIDLAGGASEPDPPVSETKFIDSCFDHSIEPADPGPEAPVIAGEMGAKMSRRKGRKAAEEATTAVQLATPEIRVDETDVDRVAGGGRVDGGIDLAGGASEPDPPVSETKFIDSCFGHSIEPADPGPEAPVGYARAKLMRLFRYRIRRFRKQNLLILVLTNPLNRRIRLRNLRR